jgi:hypothetical protein
MIIVYVGIGTLIGTVIGALGAFYYVANGGKL